MKSIDIKGRAYIPVNERVKEFHSLYKNGAIYTKIISNDEGIVVMEATVVPDISNKERLFTGHASEYQKDSRSMVNATSYIENCETSAIGRALGALGIGIDTSFASANEIDKAQENEKLNEGLKCSKCKGNMLYSEQQYSLKKFNVELCRKCQVYIKDNDVPF